MDLSSDSKVVRFPIRPRAQPAPPSGYPLRLGRQALLFAFWATLLFSWIAASFWGEHRVYSAGPDVAQFHDALAAAAGGVVNPVTSAATDTTALLRPRSPH